MLTGIPRYHYPTCHNGTGAEYILNRLLGQVGKDYILLLDDDYRPSPESISAFYGELQNWSCMKCMTRYICPSLTDLINSCGIFVINVVNPHRQFCGHIGFTTQELLDIGMPSLDVLFDELAIELRFRRSSHTVHYSETIVLEMVGHGYRKFFEQRIRYAYENLAHPIRFATHAALLPTLLVAALRSWRLGALEFIAISVLVTALAFVGQVRYGRRHYPSATWLLAAAWFWPYAVTTWVALGMFFRGGISFGGRRVKRPV